ncbi:glucosamine-phosphate N-acetyltransferase [Sarotherodon galilaeus]
MLFPDVHSAASLTVSPDRVQHFTSDSVSLTCEGNFTEWRVRKFSEDGRLSDCRRMTGSTCNINTSKSDTAVYWCESGSGEFSSAVNITVQNDDDVPILVSPVHPVTEGASVSLSCSLRTQKILSNVFFYHNDKLIQNDTRGELKISAVSKSDEGFYKCQYSGRESAQSWMSVKGADSSSSPVWLMVGLVCGVSLIIILLLLLYRCRQSKYSCFTRSIQSESHSPGSSTNHGVNQDETHVYDSVHPGKSLQMPDVPEWISDKENRLGRFVFMPSFTSSQTPATLDHYPPIHHHCCPPRSLFLTCLPTLQQFPQTSAFIHYSHLVWTPMMLTALLNSPDPDSHQYTPVSDSDVMMLHVDPVILLQSESRPSSENFLTLHSVKFPSQADRVDGNGAETVLGADLDGDDVQLVARKVAILRCRTWLGRRRGSRRTRGGLRRSRTTRSRSWWNGISLDGLLGPSS